MNLLWPRLWPYLHRHQAGALLVGLTAVHFVINLGWLALDSWTIFRVPDEFAHAGGLLHMVTSIQLGGLSEAARYLRELNSYYPMLVHAPRVLAALVFGPHPVVLHSANVVYFALLLTAVYRIGALCHGRKAGMLSAALVSLTPAAFAGWRSIGPDFPALCLGAWGFYFLLRSQDFGRLRGAAMFGVAAGAAALIKGQVLLFLIWPAAFALGRGLLQSWSTARGPGLGRRLVGAVTALCALAATTAIWWAGRLDYFLDIVKSHVTGERMEVLQGDVSLWGGVRFYLAHFPDLVSLPVAACFVLLCVPVFRSRRVRFRVELALWIFAPLVLHMVLMVRHVRYVFPLVPAVAVVVGVGLCNLPRRLQAPLVAITCVGAAALWITCSFDLGLGHRCPKNSSRASVTTCENQLAPPPGDATAGLWGALCGAPQYLAPPLARPRLGLAVTARRITKWIRTRQQSGQSLLLHVLGEDPCAVQLGVMLLTALPNAHLYMVSNVARKPTRQPPPPATWHRYYLSTFLPEHFHFEKRTMLVLPRPGLCNFTGSTGSSMMVEDMGPHRR